MTDSAADEATPAEIARLEARAARARRKREGENDAKQVWLAEFPLHDDCYAVSLDSLRATLPLRHVRPVPFAPPQVVGLVRHDGRLLTAFSLAALVGVRGWRRDPAVLVVIELSPGRLCAIDCEAIPRALPVAAEAVDEASRRATERGVFEVLGGDGTIVHLVDVGVLLERARSGP